MPLAAQALKLIQPDKVKSEEDLVVRLEDWVQKCNRLAEFGSEHELPALYKSAALQHMLTGEPKRLFER